jgi:hypothetical protein
MQGNKFLKLKNSEGSTIPTLGLFSLNRNALQELAGGGL